LADASGDVVILYGDVPALTTATVARLIARHRETGALLSLLTTTVDDPAGYGRIRRNASGEVVAIVEERDLPADEHGIREINPGIYCTSVAFLEKALARLRDDNAQREYYLTDIVATAVAEGGRVTSVAAENADEVAGINSRAELAALEAGGRHVPRSDERLSRGGRDDRPRQRDRSQRPAPRPHPRRTRLPHRRHGPSARRRDRRRRASPARHGRDRVPHRRRRDDRAVRPPPAGRRPRAVGAHR